MQFETGGEKEMFRHSGIQFMNVFQCQVLLFCRRALQTRVFVLPMLAMLSFGPSRAWGQMDSSLYSDTYLSGEQVVGYGVTSSCSSIAVHTSYVNTTVSVASGRYATAYAGGSSCDTTTSSGLAIGSDNDFTIRSVHDVNCSAVGTLVVTFPPNPFI